MLDRRQRRRNNLPNVRAFAGFNFKRQWT